MELLSWSQLILYLKKSRTILEFPYVFKLICDKRSSRRLIRPWGKSYAPLRGLLHMIYVRLAEAILNGNGDLTKVYYGLKRLLIMHGIILSIILLPGWRIRYVYNPSDRSLSIFICSCYR